MTSAKSILGCEALGYDYPGCSYSAEEASNQLHRRAIDWRYGLRWQPPGDRNILDNGDFAEWTGGTSVAPDSWTLGGAGASVARISGDAPFLYGTRITRAGTNVTFDQVVDLTAQRMRAVSFFAWIKAGAANQSRLRCVGTTTTSSIFHTGGGTYEFLQVERILTSTETNVTFRITIETTDGDVDIMGVGVIYDPPHPTGDSVDQTPHYPITSHLYLYPCDNNELRNWSFFDWSDGGMEDPDNWVSSGSGTVFRQPSQVATGGWFGPYLVQMASSAGGTTKLRQTMSAEALARMKGRYVRAGTWNQNVATGNALCRVIVIDRAGNERNTDSATNTGTAVQWLTTAAAWVDSDATGVAFEVQVSATASLSPRFWGCLLHIGSDAPAQTPHAKSADYFAIAGHNLGTQGLAIQLQGTNAEQTSAYSTVATITPTTDKAQLTTFNSASYSCWRVRIARVVGAQAAEVGMIAFGARITLPQWLSPGFMPYDREVIAAAPVAASGSPLGREVRYRPRRMRFEIPWVDESHLLSGGTIELFLRHATSLRRGNRTGLGLPFFFAWEPGDHPSDVFFAWVPDGGKVSAPLQYGIRAERVTCDALVVDE